VSSLALMYFSTRRRRVRPKIWIAANFAKLPDLLGRKDWTLGGSSQFAFQGLNIDASARIGRQLAVDHDCGKGSNTQLLSSRESPSVHHVAHDDFERRTRLSLHYVNYLFAERASCAEYFHLALVVMACLGDKERFETRLVNQSFD
jgi:hypothetical protein